MKNLLFFISFLCVFSNLSSQEKRLALVIGNSAYKHGGELRNPVNDAFTMKKALEEVGFEVQEHYNLSQNEMKKAIDDFGLKLQNYDIGLFFYAGHGIQAQGRNYLIPIDANLLSENDVEYNCIDAGRVLGKMEHADNKTNIIILDACRNNPFERSWNRSAQGRGLASMDAPVGSILAYSTAPGRTASDGTGKNGLYTSALIKFITEPELTIEDVFKRARVMVINSSDGKQTPWESTSLVGDFYLNPKQIDPRTEQSTSVTKITNDLDPPSPTTSNKSYSDKNFSRAGIVAQSLVIPGLGLSRTSGNPHWLKGVAGYGCIGGSILLNKMAISTYDDFLSANDTDAATAFLAKSSRQDLISEILAYSAIGIWMTDLIWTIAGTTDLKRNRLSMATYGLTIRSSYDSKSKAPLITLCYKF